jgi:hypothetical protein
MIYFKKIAGWVLVISGIALISWTLYSSFNIFTGKVQSPKVFTAQSLAGSQGGKSGDIQAQMEQIMQEQLKGLIPADALPKILNFTAWSLLAFVFIYGGTQVSGIGVNLLNKE